MIVILSEERSMSETLTTLFDRHYPKQVEGIDWQIIHFSGKADLEQNFVRKMRGWNHLAPHFIILRDNDGANCQDLKQRLAQRATTTGKPHHIRLVCQELESWFLGDLIAIEAAYPKSRATTFSGTAKFRDPDKLTNASHELLKLTSVSGKTSRATTIARHLDPTRNRSQSFKVLLRTLDSLFT